MKQLSKLLGLVGVLVITGLVFGSGKAHAATLNVVAGTDGLNNNGQCQLSEAVQNIVNQNAGNADCLAGDGLNDTIQLQTGTITLVNNATNISGITHDLTIKGDGESASHIDADGFSGIYASGLAHKITIQDLTITNATPYAIYILGNDDVDVSHVEVDHSYFGAYLQGVHVNVANINIHNCDSTGDLTNFDKTGLKININAVNNTDVPLAHVADSHFDNNAGPIHAGLAVDFGNHTAAALSVIVERTTVSGNSSIESTGLGISNGNIPAPMLLKIDAVTVADNNTTPLVAASNPSPFTPAYTSGFTMSIVNLSPGFNFTNVTVANNTTTNTVDNHASVAGLFTVTINAPSLISLVNSTIVGNAVTQTIPSPLGGVPAFALVNAVVGQSGPTGASSGGSAQNVIVAHNTNNGNSSSCQSAFPLTILGLPGTADITPTNLGHNLSDDQTCTGFTYAPNLYNTIEHNAADHGGAVPTIALLDGSPAIGAAAQVLGISTDARGIPRPVSDPDAGAYQHVLGASTVTPVSGNGVGVPNTGLGGRAQSNDVLLATVYCIGAALLAVGAVSRFKQRS